MDFVAVDIGASNTRYLSTDRRVYFLANNMTFISNMDDVIDLAPIDDTPENNLDVSIWKEGESTDFPTRVLIGVLADRYGRVSQRPSQMLFKADQQISYVSCIMTAALSKLKNPDLRDKMNMFIALPPTEADVKKEQFAERLAGKYTVKFNRIGKEGTTVQFEINKVACYPESRMALIQYLNDPVYAEERRKKYAGCTILSLDIGASTTDLVMFKNGNQYYDKASRTFKTGMNSARSKVAKGVLKLTGLDIPTDSIEQCMVEGRVRRGNTYELITDVLNEAKADVATDIITRLDEYFNDIRIPLTDVNYIIVSGGGSMASSYIDENGQVVKTSEPMSVHITNALNKICPGVGVEFFGDEPRLANIKGLGLAALVKGGEID